MPMPPQALRILMTGPALIGFALSAQAQTAQTPIPDSTAFGYYQFLFRHVTFLKTRADEKVAKGQTKTQLRQTYQVAANLTDSEAAILENISLQCAGVLDSVRGQMGALVSAARANPQRPKAGSPTETALAALRQQQMRAVLDHRDTLHRQFGDLRFAQFETFLRTRMTTKNSSVRPMQPHATVPMPAATSNRGAAK